MSQDQDRCPLCSRKLVMEAGHPTCLDCGYRNPYQTDALQGWMSDQYGVQGGSHMNRKEVVIGVVVAVVAVIVALAGPVAVVVVGGGVTLVVVVSTISIYKELQTDLKEINGSESERGLDSNDVAPKKCE